MPSHARASLCETRNFARPRAHLIAPLAAALLALSACGDGGGALLTPGGDDDDPPPVDCTASTCGEVRIGLTDADGDFLSYAVDVVSIRLESTDGDDVQTLPNRQRVDFAELLDVTEFVTAATIPNGTYDRAFVRLDYENAEVSVEVDGVPTPAEVVDANGDALGVVDLELTLDDANRVVIAPGVPALLQLDFDLEASHEVNLGTTPATVTAAPFLVASIEPVDTREFRVRGPLVSVNEAAGSYVVDLRPFFHRTARNGEFTVETDTGTTCEVNGDEFTGPDCITALADLVENAPTVAHGVYDVDARTFTADRVLAGDSVPGADFDTAIGVVVARNLNVLTVRGGTVVRTDGSFVFARGDIEVEVGSNTVVTKDGGSDLPLDHDSISVGQRIQAFGDASSSDFNPTLDATAGRVRLHRTHLTGLVQSVVSGELRLDLFSIDGRDPQFFDFDGTGTSLITEADPENYQMDTGTLDLDDFEDDEGAAAFGFVTAFGSAPPDFEATTLVDFDALRALLGIGWGFFGTDAPFLSMGQNGFVIDVTNVDLGARQFLKIGPRIFDITSDLPVPITVEPAESGPQLYAIAQRLEVEVFSDFGDFAARVNSLLNNGSNMRSFTARGAFDVDTTTLAANYVAVSFTAP
jgi:hypothetical protein